MKPTLMAVTAALALSACAEDGYGYDHGANHGSHVYYRGPFHPGPYESGPYFSGPDYGGYRGAYYSGPDHRLQPGPH